MINQILRDYDVRFHLVKLGPGVLGFTYRSRRGRYHVFISDELSPPGVEAVLLHETYHILKHLPNIPYIIGIDMQDTEIEKEANIYVFKL